MQRRIKRTEVTFPGVVEGLLVLDAGDVEGNLRDLCARIGLPLEERPFGSPTWDGCSIRWPISPSLGPEWLAHEIAHWLVAPPETREIPNFGFKRDPHTSEWTNPDGRGSARFDPEELRALWLGALLTVYSGMDPRDVERGLRVSRGEVLRTRIDDVMSDLYRRRLVGRLDRPMFPRWRLSRWWPAPVALGLATPIRRPSCQPS
jgi:hypothetical protein